MCSTLWIIFMQIKRDETLITLLRPRHKMRQIAATRRRDRLLQQIASCDMWKSLSLWQNSVCRCDLSHEFKLVWIRATYRSDKISASNLVAPCVRICDKSMRWNLNQPMRQHQLISRHVKFFLSSKIHYLHRTSFLSQRLVAGSVQTRGLVATMCRSDLSHRVSRPLDQFSRRINRH